MRENTTGFTPTSAISFLSFSLKHVDMEQLQRFQVDMLIRKEENKSL